VELVVALTLELAVHHTMELVVQLMQVLAVQHTQV
jgi:hypothetical protein